MTKNIAIVTAMRSELKPLRRHLALRPCGDGSGRRYEGRCDGRNLIAVVSGMGTRAARNATVELLRDYDVDHLFVVGVAGALDKRLPVGSLVCPEVVRFKHDTRSFRPVHLAPGEPRGILLSSDDLRHDRTAMETLHGDGAIALDMETAAIAEVCAAQGCPFSVFRAISDPVEFGHADYDLFHLARPDGTPDLAAVGRYLLRKPWKLFYLLQTGLGAARAIRRSTAAAEVAIRHSARSLPAR